jgi:hypothetical protein
MRPQTSSLACFKLVSRAWSRKNCLHFGDACRPLVIKAIAMPIPTPVIRWHQPKPVK